MTRPAVASVAWIGTGYRHIRANSDRDPREFGFAGSNPLNRWNESGQSTLYLASDVGVLISEWGRSFPSTYSEDPEITPVHRDVCRYALKLYSVVNLLEEEDRSHLNLSQLPATGFLDRNLGRIMANKVRQGTDVQAMLVPSVAFLDDPSRWNLVVFLEKVPADTALWITDVTRVGPLRWK